MEELLKQLTALQERALDLTKKMRELKDAFEQTIDRISVERLRDAALSFTKQLNDLQNEQEDVLQNALRLSKELSQQGPPPKPVGAIDIARQFRSVIDKLQLEARVPQGEESAATVKSLDIELKALIVVEDDEARIVTPAPGRTFEPGQLSTIRMSFGSIPLLRATDDQRDQ
jgi:hypothetical protein